jgi:hypothetical protein
VSVADSKLEAYEAVILTVVVGGALTVVTSKAWLVAPSGITSRGGMIAAGLLLDKATVMPPAGAATVIVTNPVIGRPPGTRSSPPKLTLFTARRATVKDAVFVLPEYGSVAVMVALAEVAASTVRISNI